MLHSFHKYYLRQRFFPGIFSIVINPFYFIRKSLLAHIKCLAKELNGKLLDFGCGSKPYRSLFSHVSEYIGIDVENEGHEHENEDIDVYYDGENIPFDDGTFDSILASESLEHVPNLNNILSELHRILKTNGKILISIPFVWPEHELPYDFRRFTLTGIKQALTEMGFEILSVKKSGSFFEVIIQLIMMYLHNLFYTKNKYVNLFINAIFIFPVCVWGIVFKWILPNRKALYFNTVVLAVKTG